jgi:DNA polymerase-1
MEHLELVQVQKKLPSYSLFNTTNLDDVRDSILSSKDSFVAVDTETTGLHWTTDQAFGVSLAWDDKGIFIRNTDYGTNNIGTLLKALFAAEHKTYVFHNAEFDLHMMRETYGTDMPINILDTLRLAYLKNPAESHGLKDLGEAEFGPAAGAAEDTIKEYMKQYRLKGYHQVPAEFMDPYAVLDTVLTKALAHLYIDDVMADCQFLFKVEHKLIPIIVKMEQEGLRVDIEYINQLLKEFRVEQRVIQDSIYDIIGKPVEIASTKQLQEYFYDRLRITPPAETETGQRSVNEKSLEKIQHPVGTKVAKLVLRWRSLGKLASTYLEPYKDLYGGRVHPHWNATGARTGRFSSSGPNLQNIPKDDKIRRIFVPDNEFYDFDYSQVELRIAADISGQRNMIQAFKEDADMHSYTAAMVLSKEIADVTPKERQIGKHLNFSVIYGSGSEGIQDKLEMTKIQADKVLNYFHSSFPQLRSKSRSLQKEAERNGYVRTLFGRKLPVNPDKTFTAGNYVVQGSAGDILKIALLKTAKYVDSVGGKIRNTVHDQILFDNIDETHGEELKTIMQDFNMSSEIPLKVDLQRSAVSWGDLVHD